MTEREKLIQILNDEEYMFIEEEYHGYITRVDFEKLADALIENGIGDIAEWKARTERAECILSEYNRYSEVINNKLDKAIEFVNGMLKQVKSEAERK